MERRTFLLGLVGGLAAAAGLAAAGATPAQALAVPAPAPSPDAKPSSEAADIGPEDLDGVRTEATQYWYRRRRRYYRRYYYRPRRRYYRRYYRRRYW
jgi:hypothetical protein